MRLLPIPIVALLSLGATACNGRDDDAHLVVSGHVEATEIRVATKVPGRLDRIFFEEGDLVEAGQTLAQIDSTDLALALQGARAERELANAELRLRLAGSRSEEIAAAQASVDQAEAERAAAERDLTRLRNLRAVGTATQKQLDDAQTRYDLAAARWTAANEQWLRLKRGSRSEEIDAARARLAATDARLAMARQQLSDARIVAPGKGRITQKLADPGELLGAGSPIAVVTNLDAPWLTVYLSEPDLSHVAIGQEVEVETDGGAVRRGRLIYVSSEAEFTPRNVQTRDERVKLVFGAKIALENADGLFKPGMPAEARIPRPKEPS
jgi:HlyD family secretion protein